MDIYVLGQTLEPIELVEGFTSFIWTDRYSAAGDFELKVPVGHRSLRYLRNGNFLHIKESDSLMIIRRELKNDSTGNEDLVTITGLSVESMFKDRYTLPGVNGGWTFNGRPGVVGTDLVKKICIDGSGISSLDVIPALTVEPPDGSEVKEAIEVSDGSLLSILQTLSKSDSMGFRISFLPKTKSLKFKMYRGVDRSSDLKLGPEYENLFNIRYNRDSTEYKNVAYVYHKDMGGPEIVYRNNHTGTTGYPRRVIFVDANDIQEPTTQKLWRRGRDELGKYDYIHVSDGEIPLRSKLLYKRDYNIGDTVQVSYDDESTTKLTIAEHIWSFDSDGPRSYPTLQYIEV